MARNEFEKEVSDLLKSLFPIAERVDDVAFNRAGGRQVSKKPWDYYGVTQQMHLFWVAEVKRVKATSIPFANFKEHQLQALSNVNKLGLFAWVFINWRIKRLGRAGIAVWLPYVIFETAIDEVKPTRSSLRHDHFHPAWRLERITGGWCVPEEHPYYHGH